MYLKKGEYENALQLFERNKHLAPTDQNRSPLITISLIFGWSFDKLEILACRCLCDKLYATGCTKEVLETVSSVVNTFDVGDKEAVYGRILEEVITRSGDVTLLAWNGKRSTYHSCLPSSSSPTLTSCTTQKLSNPTTLETKTADLERRIERLRETLSQLDAIVIYDRISRLPTVRFADGRLHLPCIVFRIKGLSITNFESKENETLYRAKVVGLGKVDITTSDPLPLNEPEKLVLVHPWIQEIRGTHEEEDLEVDTDSDEADSDACGDSDAYADVVAQSELIPASLVNAAPSTPSDALAYVRALELLARIGEPFNAFLLLQQSGCVYKRVAADHEIIVQGFLNAPKLVRAEVLGIL